MVGCRHTRFFEHESSLGRDYLAPFMEVRMNRSRGTALAVVMVLAAGSAALTVGCAGRAEAQPLEVTYYYLPT